MQTLTKLWYLEQFDIFKVLSRAELNQVAETSIHKPYKKDDPIMFPFNSQKTIYLLKDGSVKVGNYTENGEENLKYLLNSGKGSKGCKFLEFAEFCHWFLFIINWLFEGLRNKIDLKY